MTGSQGLDGRQWIDHRMGLAREWDDLVAEVRALDAFADFLRPPPLPRLLSAARNGPVVVVNVSRWRCDALVVRQSGVEAVPLRALTADEVQERATAYLASLRDDVMSADLSYQEALAARRAARLARQDLLRKTMEWLWDVVAEPVLGFLGYLEGAPPTDLPRLWWCPTGLLTLLPLHGAGYHDGSGRAVIDRVVSSYTPTLRALAEMPSDARVTAADEPMLFVGMPSTTGQLDLTAEVASEQALLEDRVPGGLTVLAGADASVDVVRKALAGHRWAHLSCHGRQDVANPSAAGLELVDGTLTIPLLSTARHTGDFVFLSACRTATGGLDLADEVITLAAALSYTGYRHVVATLWSVDPAVAAELAADVYTEMFRERRFDPEQAALALHHGVHALRSRERLLDEWLPFTHTGP